MKYYINPIWFYLMGVSTGLKILLCVVGVVLTVVFGIELACYLFDSWDVTDMDENEVKTFKILRKIIMTGIILLFIGILVPSKETCVEMMVASQVTHENVTATKEEIYDIIDYVTDKVKGEEK